MPWKRGRGYKGRVEASRVVACLEWKSKHANKVEFELLHPWRGLLMGKVSQAGGWSSNTALSPWRKKCLKEVHFLAGT